MTTSPVLFMIMLGCTPPGRNTEQHDIYFGIGPSINELKQEIVEFWPEAMGRIHLDAWRRVTSVDGYSVSVRPADDTVEDNMYRLFFLNLGGYRKDEFDEFHYKMLVVAENKADAIRKAKESGFYRNMGFKGAPSHIDDRFGIDIDELHEIPDILSDDMKNRYKIHISPGTQQEGDEIHLGYMKLDQAFV